MQAQNSSINPHLERLNAIVEKIVVLFFITIMPVGLGVFCYQSWDSGTFEASVVYISFFVVALAFHVQCVQPYMTNWPFYMTWSRLTSGKKPLIRRVLKLTTARRALKNWVHLTLYRLTWTGFLIWLAWNFYQLHGSHFLWFVGMYLATGFGITIGYHRLATHPSFKTRPAIRFTFIALGCMALQGPPGEWAKKHTKHHPFSDTSADPHSPFWGRFRRAGLITMTVWSQCVGAFHAFIGWPLREPALRRKRNETIDEYRERLLKMQPSAETFYYRSEDRKHWENTQYPLDEVISRKWKKVVEEIVKIEEDPQIKFLSYTWVYLSIFALGIALPYFLGGVTIWESIARLAILNWVTYCVNSVCHLWGEQVFESNDNSRNNTYIAVLALGEGNHGTHHGIARSCKHGIFPWEPDASYEVIAALARVGLAKELSQPSRVLVIRYWKAWRSKHGKPATY